MLKVGTIFVYSNSKAGVFFHQSMQRQVFFPKCTKVT